ncbi:hypothetical protein, partial [Enterobacter cloacae complex sp. 4DZ3-17B2]|uniref:hypothetical protein n=1 Tax=Enterobacter cloacae complex sp. 4DZ3-17B2 TaxID=2511990 RepID=UPI001CA47808
WTFLKIYFRQICKLSTAILADGPINFLQMHALTSSKISHKKMAVFLISKELFPSMDTLQLR